MTSGSARNYRRLKEARQDDPLERGKEVVEEGKEESAREITANRNKMQESGD